MLHRYILFFLLSLFIIPASAQNASDYAVQLTATVQVSPPQIKLNWKKLTGTTSYAVFRKAKIASSWTSVATLTAADSFYADNNVVADSAYEYQVTKAGGGINASGFIYAGIQSPAIHNRGTLLLLVDSLFIDSCKAQLYQLMKDLRSDGWAVVRHDVNRNAAVTSIKAIIVNDYLSQSGVAAVLLVGHIPVPYSGDLNPDGHPDHLGAWPADVYYADMDGIWTDNIINDTLASRTQNRNKPGDGKWDQTSLPSNAELQISRIDFANMPAFTKTEVQLMTSYLNKDHLYKMDSIVFQRKGLVDDNFGAFGGEAFAATAWRAFPTMLGNNNIASLDFITTLKDSAYQWAYGCGGGSYTSAGGIGNTSDFTTNPVKGIFTLMFGSYFGDWDAQNNFLRAPLCASNPALTCAWAGRPNWFLHHMALGENIGYSTLLTQNNSFLYTPGNYGNYYVHVALMGDGSLRTDYIKPPVSITIAATVNSGATINWVSSPAPGVIGYYVYRSNTEFGSYQKISALTTGNSFHDNSGTNGLKYYLVRPVALQQTPSGTYYNLGIGVADSAHVTYPVGIAAVFVPETQLTVFPNPAKDILQVIIERQQQAGTATVQVTDAVGRVMLTQNFSLRNGVNSMSLNVARLPVGMYTLLLRTPEGSMAKKWVKAE